MKVDYLNITIPNGDHSEIVRSEIIDLLLVAGAVSVTFELLRIKGGTVVIAEKQGYHYVSLSGVSLDCLRAQGLYKDFLSILTGAVHKVTKMDIAHDTPEYTPVVLDELYQRANYGEGVHLTRKKVRHNRKIVSRSYYDTSDTGTLYLGNSTAEVRCRVYDKRQERIVKGAGDIGVPLTRYELTVSNKSGVSLSDAEDPSSIFWHFMSDVLSPPVGYVDGWVKGSFSFPVPPRVKKASIDQIRDRIDRSFELPVLVRLSDDLGPNGRTLLIRLLSGMVGSHAKLQPDVLMEPEKAIS